MVNAQRCIHEYMCWRCPFKAIRPITSAIPAADKALGGRGFLPAGMPVGTANAFNPLALAPLPGVCSRTSARFAACDGL
jgi:hypothetical protein